MSKTLIHKAMDTNDFEVIKLALDQLDYSEMENIEDSHELGFFQYAYDHCDLKVFDKIKSCYLHAHTEYLTKRREENE